MGKSAFEPETIQHVATLLAENTDIEPDCEGLAEIFSKCFADSEQFSRQYRTRDTLPTTAELRETTAEIYRHLFAVWELLKDSHVAAWMDTFMKDRGIQDPGAFLKVVEYMHVARDAAQYFQQCADENVHMTITDRDGTMVEHQRKTRTEFRDTLLIPPLLVILRGYGLRLQGTKGTWNYEALDCACQILEALLGDLKVPLPSAGSTELGEKYQGRLRRIIKTAWSDFPPAVDN